MAIEVGVVAPDFVLRGWSPEGIQEFSLSSFRGKPVVLLFFPAAFTGVCTEEFCTASPKFEDGAWGDVQVLGVSCDTPFALGAWAKQNNISVPLLSDYQRKVIADFDVVLADLAGLGPAAQRASFVIDADGMVRYVEVTETPSNLPNFEALTTAIKALQ